MADAVKTRSFGFKGFASLLGGAAVGLFIGAAVLASFFNPLTAIALGGILGGFLGVVRHHISSAKENDIVNSGMQAVKEGKEISLTLAPPVPEVNPGLTSHTVALNDTILPETQKSVSPTPQQKALAEVATALDVAYQPEEISDAMPAASHTQSIKMKTVPAKLTTEDKTYLDILAAFSRGEVTNEEALAAYRGLREEISQPLIEEGVKIGLNVAMKEAGVGGHSAEMNAELLAKPLSEKLSAVVHAGAVEKFVAFGAGGGLAGRVAMESFKYMFPDRPVKEINGKSLELDLARAVGKCANLVSQIQPSQLGR